MKNPKDATQYLKVGEVVTVDAEKPSKKGDGLLCHIVEGHALTGLKVIVFFADKNDKLFQVRITRVNAHTAFGQKYGVFKRLGQQSYGSYGS